MTTASRPESSMALPSGGLIPIRTVSSLTGVNPVTLRAWERRYGLIRPERTPKGHRLYTMEDVERIRRVLQLLQAGMSIGQVRQVLADGTTGSEGAAADETADIWSDYRRGMIEAIIRFDEAALDEQYNEALSLYPVDIVTARLLVPLLQDLGHRWERTRGGVAEEHFFSVYLRNKLGARLHHLGRGQTGPRLLLSCLPGEQHEVGILLFALAAMDRNYRVVVLGADTPLEELPEVVERAACDALVLAGSVVVPVKVVRQHLARLVESTPVPVYVGGRVTARFPAEIDQAGARALPEDIGLAVRTVDADLNPRHAA